MNSNWGYAYANGFDILAECLDIFGLGAILTRRGKTNPSGKSPVRKEVDNWALDLEEMGSRRMKTSAFSVRIYLADGLNDWAPF
jgi:hypothetical protein